MAAKYSLEALRTLRAAREDARGRELGDRVRELTRLAADTEAARAELDRLESERRQSRNAENERLAAGGLSAEELVHGLEHEEGRALRERERRGQLERAETAETEARAERDRALAALAAAHAEREAVERHHQGFVREQLRIAEDAADQDALDRFNCGTLGPGKP